MFIKIYLRSVTLCYVFKNVTDLFSSTSVVPYVDNGGSIGREIVVD